MLLRFVRFLAGKCSPIDLKQISIHNHKCKRARMTPKRYKAIKKLICPCFNHVRKCNMQLSNLFCGILPSQLKLVSLCLCVCVCAHLPRPLAIEAHRDVLTRQMWQKNVFAVLGRRDWFGNPSVMHVSILVECAWRKCISALSHYESLGQVQYEVIAHLRPERCRC